MNAENIKKQAKLALPTEYPLVFAFVTLPTASNLSVITLIWPSYYDIYAIPPALSAIGPKPLMLRTKTPVENMPMVATAVAKRPPCSSVYLRSIWMPLFLTADILYK